MGKFTEAIIRLLPEALRPQEKEVEIKEDKKAFYAVNPSSTGSFMFTIGYDGEKNVGEAGPIINYLNDYNGLRARSWQLYYESEIAQTIIKRSVTWTISRGLRLEAQPNELVLQSEGYAINKDTFKGIDDIIEARWKVWAASKKCSYDGIYNLAGLAREQQKNKWVAGDVLVVLRYKKNQLTVQLIDGACVKTPYGIVDWMEGMPVLPGSERVINGVVLNDRGQHVAYWVQTSLLAFERVECVSKKTGMTMAYMVYGQRYRLNNTRGIPLLSVVNESAKILDRYKTATLGNAEETAKTVMSVEHESFSDGGNPMTENLTRAINPTKPTDIAKDIDGNVLANNIAVTTGKQVFNMPIGAKLTKLNHTAELHYKEFFETNANAICSTVSIPPEVAFMKYDSNFSASRAALKDWEHTIIVNRDEAATDFYQPIYSMWLFIEVMTGKINLPGYLQAYMENNQTALDAFTESLWKGPTVPHIDPKKEVEAVRAMLGDNAASLPLTTLENATEMLNQGDYDENAKQFAEELQEAKDMNVYIEPIRGGGNTANPQEMQD